MSKNLRKTKSKIGKTPFTPLTVVMLVVLLLYTLTLIWLLYWGVITSLKGRYEFIKNTYKLPIKAVTDNFVTIFTKFRIDVDGGKSVGMAQMYLYSVLYAVGCAITNTAVPCVTAYFCAKFKYKWSKVMHTTVIIAMIIPVVGSLPSEIQVADFFGLRNHIWGLWIMKANFLGLYFLVFYAFFASLPDSYIEAAKIDGAGNVSVLVKIALPLARSIFFTVLLVNFIAYWNDYQTPLVYIRDKYPTAAFGVFRLSTLTNFPNPDNPSRPISVTVPIKVAGAVMLFTPMLILFILTNKMLLGNLNVGGIKG